MIGIILAVIRGMSRKKLIHSSEFPYHIVARTNNKEEFPLELSDMWEIYSYALRSASVQFNFQVHAFVLMNNHYHLVASTHKDHKLGKVMHAFQLCVSKIVNERTGRINHLFGSRYKACLIEEHHYYANVIKYVFRNPVTAGIGHDVRDYRYSSLRGYVGRPTNLNLFLSSHVFERSIRKEFGNGLLKWLNDSFVQVDHEKIRRALHRTVFKPAILLSRVKEPLEEFPEYK